MKETRKMKLTTVDGTGAEMLVTIECNPDFHSHSGREYPLFRLAQRAIRNRKRESKLLGGFITVTVRPNFPSF